MSNLGEQKKAADASKDMHSVALCIDGMHTCGECVTRHAPVLSCLSLPFHPVTFLPPHPPPSPSLSLFYHCDKIPGFSNSREERFILPHNGGRYNPSWCGRQRGPQEWLWLLLAVALMWPKKGADEGNNGAPLRLPVRPGPLSLVGWLALRVCLAYSVQAL